MEIQDIDNEILVKQTQIRVERDPVKKQELNKELKVLQMKKEIEIVRMKIAQIS